MTGPAALEHTYQSIGYIPDVDQVERTNPSEPVVYRSRNRESAGSGAKDHGRPARRALSGWPRVLTGPAPRQPHCRILGPEL